MLEHVAALRYNEREWGHRCGYSGTGNVQTIQEWVLREVQWDRIFLVVVLEE